MHKFLDQEVFLEKYKIPKESFLKTKLKWVDLEEIYTDYNKEIPNLEESAIYIFNTLMKIPDVHSVRYRIKNAEHVIEKIIRKKIDTPARDMSLKNYKIELTDLIGIRALHLFKEQWPSINEVILDKWDLKEKPVANYREGDATEYIDKFKNSGCETKIHDFGYRSVHYIVTTKPAKLEYLAEIQVRTIFEEAWSEIDHTIRYPYDQDNPVFGQFLLILNRLAGSADEMGTFISSLKTSLQTKDEQHRKALSEKDNLILELEKRVKQLKLGETDYSFLKDGLERLKDQSSNQNSRLSLFSDTLNSINSDYFHLYRNNMEKNQNLYTLGVPPIDSLIHPDYITNIFNRPKEIINTTTTVNKIDKIVKRPIKKNKKS